ncbi:MULTISPECIES: LLM class flavin-dependent oxidoreductase [unclassified Niallia]|uniref:LLM class flavin-dependent oxidoreductase n=1 Tax=unclassified Niallia TaxID=2837522 RepID=UPI001EDB88EA|nr:MULTISPECIES: LLM class flavin-dependent oxidoreductase [unclassified Niallia]MCM3033382.1 LLM class flavin-dependent oxidoreductase [Niallia sp. MER 6]MDL0434303.1 LLM class flavin-dependent oxidoreductase [Niallia sp. SS-2023]UPO89052.1 LLM class flavin-dependent oxidoreductase [Niallia sp. Man26]
MTYRTKGEKMRLNLFLTSMGHHEGAWRHPASAVESVQDFRLYQEIAAKAERAKFDSIFMANRYSVSTKAVTYGELGGGGMEPLILLSALAAVTKEIGLIGTVSTSFTEPFNVARSFSSLDHLSKGRAGWNVITSGTDEEAKNFNLEEIPDHEQRYVRAQEFLEVTNKLWDSWEADALVKDKATGVYALSEKVHEINHKGSYFSVKGPLNSPRSPQGKPVIVQAGSSKDGIDFAAQYAEIVFTAQQTLEDAQIFYKKLKSRVQDFGRDPSKVIVLPGICPVIANTDEEAKAKETELHKLTNPAYSLLQLSNRVGFDLTSYPLDGPFPELPDIKEIKGHQSRTKLISDLAKKENLTLRQLLLRLAGGRGHFTIAGTPERIADELQVWFENGAADGFNIMPQQMSEGLTEFIESVIPELQNRGLFKTEYTDGTLRDKLGI